MKVGSSVALTSMELKRFSPFGDTTLYNVAASVPDFNTTMFEGSCDHCHSSTSSAMFCTYTIFFFSTDLSHRLLTTPDEFAEVFSLDHEVVIALGTNVGDMKYNFNQALQKLNDSAIKA